MKLSDLIKVQLKTIYASPTGNFQPGNEIEVTEQEANDLVNGGYAVLVASPIVEEETLPEEEENSSKKNNPSKKKNNSI